MKKKNVFSLISLSIVILLLSTFFPAVDAAAHDRHHSDEYVDIIVSYHDDIPDEEELDESYKNVKSMNLIPTQTMSVPASEVKAISQQENVKRVTYDQEMTTKETTVETAETGEYWNQEMIGTFDAWQEGFMGESVSVAVVDTGFYDHPDINFAGGVSVFEEDGELGPDDWNNDHDGHGTHVAGVIGAQQGSQAQGIAPRVQLYGIKIYHEENGNSTNASNLAHGIEAAIELGVDIITVSSGYPTHNEDIKDMIDLAVANDIMVVAASGNVENDGDTIDYPAAYPEVIAVANVDSDFTRVFDSMISTENELSAPGQGILGLAAPVEGGNYVTMSGTSQSTPHVAGIAALLMQKYPGEDAAQIRQRMTGKALDLGETGHDELYGYGLVQFSPLDSDPIEDDDEDENENEEEDNQDETDETDETGEDEESVDEAPPEEDPTEDDDSSGADEDIEEDLEEDDNGSEPDTSLSTVWVRPSETNNIATITSNDIDAVADNGVLAVSFDSTFQSVSDLILSSEQVEELKERNITLMIARIDLEWVIPSENLQNGEAVLNFESASGTYNQAETAKSDIITFSIEQDGQMVNDFSSPMTYRFFTDQPDLNEDSLYLWDEAEEEWTLLGDSYTNGGIEGSMPSVGTLAVFGSESSDGTNQEASSDENDEDDDEQETGFYDGTGEDETDENEADSGDNNLGLDQSDEATEDDETEEASSASLGESFTDDLPTAIVGGVVILAAVGGGFYFFGGKSKE